MGDPIEPAMRSFFAWWTVSDILWWLLAGWVAVAASLAFGFEVPASGSLLVLSGLIAELRFSGWALLHIGHKLQPIQYGREPETGDPWREIGKIATESEQLKKPDNICYFLPNRTVPRISRRLQIFIASQLALGTVLWAYGHLLFG